MKQSILVIISSLITISYAQNCVPRNFGEDSIVCVCNATYCDFVPVDIPPKGKFKTYISSRSGERFTEEIHDFQTNLGNGINLQLNQEKQYQIIRGFGGAFTDSAGLNIKTLSNDAQDLLIQSYFKPEGSNYNLCRVPVGGTDFSTKPYTLDDHQDDITLSNFALAPEDNDYKIPYMKMALDMNSDLRFVAASWTAPPWMKTNNDYSGFLGFLRREYYQTYADYLVKFLEAYKDEGLPIWAISTGNEPADVFFPGTPINDMGWIPSTVAQWLVHNFGPSVMNSSSAETLILAIDDQRFDLPWYLNDMYQANSDVDKYIAGIAVHWYADQLFPVSLYDRTNKLYPDKFLLMTEACRGSLPWEFQKVRLGSWRRGESYILSIIEDLNHWITGWIDWNLALDKKGGPNWSKNNVDSPIIVNPETDEFFKQPMYYAMAHFSKFIVRGSMRVDLTPSCDIKSVAFRRPDNAMVIVLYNGGNDSKSVTIQDPEQGNIIINISGQTIMTIIYQ